MEGWIKLYRKSIDSQVFKNPYLWQLWTWCLMKANHQECWVDVKTGRGETQVKLKPGQFIFGRHSAAKELGWPPSTVRNRLAFLENMENLDNQTGQHYSIVSIRNWDIYQTSGRDVEKPKRTSKGQPKDTDKNNKKEKYSPTSHEVRLALLLFNKIKGRDSKAKEPDIQNWAIHIDRLIRIDKRNAEEIEAVIEWCQQDSFWQKNILSTEKLRKQYQQLLFKSGLNKAKKEDWGKMTIEKLEDIKKMTDQGEMP